jgi:hypothetical protein
MSQVEVSGFEPLTPQMPCDPFQFANFRWWPQSKGALAFDFVDVRA